MGKIKTSDDWSMKESRRKNQAPRTTVNEFLRDNFGSALGMYMLGVVILAILIASAALWNR